MKTKSIKKNYIFNTCYQILLLIVPIITTPYLSRVLGPSGIGLNSYANAMIGYFTLFACLGTGTYGQRSISYVQDDIEKRSRVFWETFFFRTIMVLITLLFYGIYLFTIKENLTIYLVLGLNLINIIFDVTWFFQGLEEFEKTVTRNALVKLLNIIFIFTFIKEQNDLILYVLGSVTLTVIGSMSLWTYIPKYVIKVKNIKPFRDIKTIIKLFIPTIAIQVYTIVDKSMLGWFSGSNYLENGYYEQAEKIAKIFLTLVTSLGTVMIPRIGKTYKDGNLEKVKEYLYRSYRFVWFLAVPIMLGTIAVSTIFVPLFFGEGFEKVNILLPILSVLVIVIGLSNVNGYQYFVPIGKENILTLTVIVGAVSNLLLNLILIPKFYSIGACISTVLAETLVTLTGFIYIRKRKLFSLKTILLDSKNYFISGIIMFIILISIKQILGQSVFDLALLIVLGILIYTIGLFILRDNLLINIIEQTKNTLKSRLKK